MEMQQLDHALDGEILEIDMALLRLTTLRVLMAGGNHQLVDLAVTELSAAMQAMEQAGGEITIRLADAGYDTLDEAIADNGHESGLRTRTATARSLHRELRVALATTEAAAEQSIRLAAEGLGELAPISPAASNRHPFLSE